MSHEEPAAPQGPVVELLAQSGTGPLWGMASADLNATLLAWEPGHELAEHVNDELDVLVVVLDGSGGVTVDGTRHELETGTALLVPKGARRAIVAGDEGMRYLTVHRRREPLQIQAQPER